MCSFHDGHGRFTCVNKYLIAMVYGRFTLAIVIVKWLFTIGVKYLTPQAKLPFYVRRFSSVCIYYIKFCAGIFLYTALNLPSLILAQ